MNLPILYTFRRCPYAMRARMALFYANCNVTIREISLKNKPSEMLQASAKATVPVLILPNGSVIDESIEIMQWALTKSDTNGWLTSNNYHLAKELILTNDNKFKPLLDGYKYSSATSLQLSLNYRDNALEILRNLDQRLGNTTYLISNHISLADVAIMPFIRQFHMVDEHYFSKVKLVNLSLWLHNFLNTSLFSTIMKKFPQWQPGTTSDITLF